MQENANWKNSKYGHIARRGIDFCCVKIVRIRSYSGLYFPAFELNMVRYGVSVFSPNVGKYELE